jgi:EAL domain-containing protein (putative c-di-GMP-specific phosphodiesterase class I)
MTATVDRIIAVNLDAELLESLRALRNQHGVNLVTAATEADLLANLMDGSAVVALGLQSQGLSPLSVLRALGMARCRPAVVLIGEVDERLYQSIQRLGSKLRLDSMAYVSRSAEGTQLIASLLHAVRTTAAPQEAELRRAIEEQELMLHYQPKFACDDDRSVVGVEALVRWNHPELGLLRPAHFLPLASATGLLMDVTDFTITEAIRQHAAWQAHGIDLPVAINLAPGLIRDDGFPDRLMNTFRQFGVSPSRFTLEVKESDSTGDRELCMDVFTRLRLAGVALALDDYGSGLSSLTELYKLPFTELKIDRALVADAPTSGDARIVMRGIVRLAHELAINVCAEGVETRAELNAAIAAGCNFVQGTLLCEPDRPEEIERSLADARKRYVATQPFNREARSACLAS